MSTSSDRRRVAVTGIGTVSAAGVGHEAFWNDLLEPSTGPINGTIAAFDPSPWFKPNEARRSEPYIIFAVAAAELALEDAGSPDISGDRAGVVMGNLYGAATSLETQREVLDRQGPGLVSPLICALGCEDACATQLSIRFGCRGPSKLVVTACATGTTVIGEGAAMVADGTSDVVLAGSTLGTLTEVIKASYRNLRIVSDSGHARPFDLRRDGFVFAEGAAVVVLEEWDRAISRGAHIYGTVAGWGLTNDAFHYSKPSGEGIERSMRRAIEHAGLGPGDIVHVNAHGTGTKVGDIEESEAVRRVFGSPGPSVTSIKGSTGHALAAAGTFEVASVLLAFENRLLPPTGHDLHPDPEISVDLVTGEARPWTPGPSVSNSVGLGGQNASVVLLPA